jgi:hypothetical protein
LSNASHLLEETVQSCQDHRFQEVGTGCRRVIVLLANRSPPVRSTCRETLDCWYPDEPTATTLFVALGERIVEAFDDVDPEVNRGTFRSIEAAMADSSDRLVAAVA